MFLQKLAGWPISPGLKIRILKYSPPNRHISILTKPGWLCWFNSVELPTVHYLDCIKAKFKEAFGGKTLYASGSC